MKWTSTFRVLKMGFVGIWRNGWLSLTAISVMFLVFMTVNVFLLFGKNLNDAIGSIEDKVDFTIFFQREAEEVAILEVRDLLSSMPEVKETHYLSKEDALNLYRQEQPDIDSSISEYGNPFSASLDIKTTDPELIDRVVQRIQNNPEIKKIKYSKQTVEVINQGTQLLRSAGLFLIVFLIAISFLVVLNTVRLAIYTRRREIEIMRLVGATDWFIRWPFIFEAVYDGVIAAVLATAVLYFAFDAFSVQLVDLSQLLKLSQPEFGIRQALQYGLYQVMAGITLGAVSAFVAIRRHMRD